MTTATTTLLYRARAACNEIAEGQFTPIVIRSYDFIGGERGTTLSYPSITGDGHGCVIHLSKPRDANGRLA